MVHGLANSAAAAIVAARADQPFTSVDDLWPRVDVPVAALVQIAEADAFLPRSNSPVATLYGRSRR